MGEGKNWTAKQAIIHGHIKRLMSPVCACSHNAIYFYLIFFFFSSLWSYIDKLIIYYAQYRLTISRRKDSQHSLTIIHMNMRKFMFFFHLFLFDFLFTLIFYEYNNHRLWVSSEKCQWNESINENIKIFRLMNRGERRIVSFNEIRDTNL